MSDLSDQLIDTNGITMANAVESANDTTLSCVIANESVDPITSETVIAITGNSTTIARTIAPGST